MHPYSRHTCSNATGPHHQEGEPGLGCPSGIIALQPEVDAGAHRGQGHCVCPIRLQFPGVSPCGPAAHSCCSVSELPTAPFLASHSSEHQRKLGWGTGAVSLGGRGLHTFTCPGNKGKCKFGVLSTLRIWGGLEFKKKNTKLTAVIFFLE